ncbi:hypothetical protein GGTG_13279 [Gaeumannomyces tritici R3-111a-1]|uniref:Uncharacterized protein n=1 Tax=Gaeumannomyces tritici (strain R3-111a-1) TaxID=644352 RepID=J3PIF1_GAET3|nr:hypothetical protein GGTG_13279 [Gaeumannomyces tritici R3-111a-1]EJT69170.1 hypothetical protein GGTG_13279 [Gaeumannomyces tritici R3-111a-1]
MDEVDLNVLDNLSSRPRLRKRIPQTSLSRPSTPSSPRLTPHHRPTCPRRAAILDKCPRCDDPPLLHRHRREAVDVPVRYVLQRPHAVEQPAMKQFHTGSACRGTAGFSSASLADVGGFDLAAALEPPHRLAPHVRHAAVSKQSSTCLLLLSLPPPAQEGGREEALKSRLWDPDRRLTVFRTTGWTAVDRRWHRS